MGDFTVPLKLQPELRIKKKSPAKAIRRGLFRNVIFVIWSNIRLVESNLER